jgi:hypothetical protein
MVFTCWKHGLLRQWLLVVSCASKCVHLVLTQQPRLPTLCLVLNVFIDALIDCTLNSLSHRHLLLVRYIILACW